MAPQIGIAIATFNSVAVIRDCLMAVAREEFFVVLFDDGSTDDTVKVARNIMPNIKVLHGDGQNWWAGSTRKAIQACLDVGCEVVVMLNPDVILEASALLLLVGHAKSHPNTITAPLLVNKDNPQKIAWAGSRFSRLAPGMPIFVSRYIHKAGSPVEHAGHDPYPSDEVHGRGVVLTADVIEHIGLLDDRCFPHYGADNDYSLRAHRAGIRMHILPSVHAILNTRTSGMATSSQRTLQQRLRDLYRYLTQTKNGDAVRVNWKLYSRHLPFHQALPTAGVAVLIGSLRRLLK